MEKEIAEQAMVVTRLLERLLPEMVAGTLRLLSEAHAEVGLALQGEVQPAREQELTALRREVDQLRDGVVSRGIIERAKGILMQGQGISESQSFDLLNELSQRHRRKLRDVAADVASGTLLPRLAVVRPDAALPEQASRHGERHTRNHGSSGADRAPGT
jgi:hypothetical protein